MDSSATQEPTLKTEAIAGITTFFTMAYIVIVNPQILSANGKTGMAFTGVLTATVLICFTMTMLMGVYAKRCGKARRCDLPRGVSEPPGDRIVAQVNLVAAYSKGNELLPIGSSARKFGYLADCLQFAGARSTASTKGSVDFCCLL